MLRISDNASKSSKTFQMLPTPIPILKFLQNCFKKFSNMLQHAQSGQNSAQKVLKIAQKVLKKCHTLVHGQDTLSQGQDTLLHGQDTLLHAKSAPKVL